MGSSCFWSWFNMFDNIWCMFELLSEFTSSCFRPSPGCPLSLFLPHTTSCYRLFSRQNLHIFLFWKLRGSAQHSQFFVSHFKKCQNKWYIPPKFNIASEKWWLEDSFSIGKVTFQERTVKLREGILSKFNSRFASEKWTAFEPKNHLSNWNPENHLNQTFMSLGILKGKDRFLTIKFQVLLLLVSG